MYHEVPDLEFITLTKIVSTLWSGHDIENSMAEYFLQRRIDNWTDIEESVNLKIENFNSLPKILKIKLLGLVKPIGIRLKDMIEYTYDNDYLPNHFTSMFSWTFLGTINVTKTAEAMIKDENLCVTKRYELACKYFLKNNILLLWDKLSEEEKNNYSGDVMGPDVVSIAWAYIIKKDRATLHRKIEEQRGTALPLGQIGHGNTLEFSNLLAFKYLVRKVNMEKGLETYWYYFHILKDTESGLEKRVIQAPDIIFFLYSEMKENQQTRTLQRYAYNILKNFLEFPFQRFFLKTARKAYKYLTNDQKSNLIQDIRHKESEKYTDFDYQTLRTELSKM